MHVTDINRQVYSNVPLYNCLGKAVIFSIAQTDLKHILGITSLSKQYTHAFKCIFMKE
jgi:hypothetical protein